MEPIKPTLRLLRLAKELTCAEMGAALGLSPNTINRWERGQYPPTLDQAQRLAEFFGVPLADVQAMVKDAKASRPSDEAGPDESRPAI